MKFSKKVMSVALCTALISGGSLATLANVAHADSNNAMCSRSAEGCWTESLNLRLKRKSTCQKATIKLNLVKESNKNISLRLDTNNIPDLYDFMFDDEYIIGVQDYYSVNEKFLLNNKNIGPFKNGNVVTEIQNLITKFNSLKLSTSKDIKPFFYAHGVGSDNSLTFSGGNIKTSSSKNYDRGYASRCVNKWQYGFQIFDSAMYECTFFHSK